MALQTQLVLMYFRYIFLYLNNSRCVRFFGLYREACRFRFLFSSHQTLAVSLVVGCGFEGPKVRSHSCLATGRVLLGVESREVGCLLTRVL